MLVSGRLLVHVKIPPDLSVGILETSPTMPLDRAHEEGRNEVQICENSWKSTQSVSTYKYQYANNTLIYERSVSSL